MNHQGLDHIAIVVPDTDAALSVWRDQLGLKEVHSEVVQDGSIRLTHLDFGNTELQLVQPLSPDHPLNGWLAKRGPGLHHFCLKVADIDESIAEEGSFATGAPHQGILGKRAIFLDPESTGDVLVELTGK